MPSGNPVIFTKRNGNGLFEETDNEVVVGDGTNTLDINPDGSINVVTSGGGTAVTLNELGKIDTNNSTSANLGIGGVFTGVGTDILNYAVLVVSIFSDEISAIDGIEFQFSDDNIIFYTTDRYSYLNNGDHAVYSLQTVEQYFRIVYTNGITAQTSFHISTALKQTAGVASSHRIADDLSHGEVDAQLTKSVIAAKRPTGEYTNVDATPEGKLEVSVVTPTGVLPVSQLTTLHDGKIINKVPPTLLEVAGTGTATYANNKYNMSVAAGQWNVITGKRHTPYFSGKPQKVEFTFDGFAPETNVTKRVGYFSSSTISPYDTVLDGLWLESSGGTISMKAVRAGVTTIDVDILDWSNYASLGDYQTLANWDNFTVCEFNFLWLGGAYIELRLVTSAGFTTVHNIVYAGNSPDIFMLSPNQPIRYELRSTTGTGSFRYICNQIATGGSISESGFSRGINTGVTPIIYAAIGTTYPVLGIKKQAIYRDNPVLGVAAGIFITTNDRLRWTMQINPTLSAGLTYTPEPDSVVEKGNGDGVITVTADGTIIASGYLALAQSIPSTLFANNYLTWLSGNLDGTQDEVILCITPITTNIGALADMTYLEY